ncbi:MarR family winged helix-turn-helix transcriptional regulator [Agrobacterium tumefaciens]|uniref:MarR family winged helix-turn-helix transcriptional regulator n=1 Tax=Agrobacterium tumefaciens TaxID=358 RepID=UPI003BA06027
METPHDPHSINYRIREGLARIATIVRVDEWNRAKTMGLNPTQLAILTALDGRAGGLGVKDVAAHLGISQPTATDSLNALEKKSLVERRASAEDRRAIRVHLTTDGTGMLQSHQPNTLAERALASLESGQHEELLLLLVTMIRELQEQNAIPQQRMCVSCQYFSPFEHSGSAQPHHCKFVDAAFGQSELRIDCRDQSPSNAQKRASDWKLFQAESAPL